MSKNTKKTSILDLVGKLIAIVIFTVLAIAILPWVFIGVGSCVFTPNPPTPEIKHGEFPFRLEYEIRGQKVVIEDTLVCKFDGFSTGIGEKFYKWKEYLAGDKTWLKKPSSARILIDKENSIYLDIGNAQHYLGFYRYTNYYSNRNYNYDKCEIWAFQIIGSNHKTIGLDELLDKYGIRIISWEPSPSIVNNFR